MTNEIIYNKLIRDNIPEIIQKSGKIAIVEIAEDEELLNFLNTKLSEELKEYNASGDVEELADLVEVVHAILDQKGVSIEQFKSIREEKNQKIGAFKKGLVLLKVIED